jgi:hypothetical protein
MGQLTKIHKGNMKTFHVAVWTGPTMVSSMACKFRMAGLTVTCEGTERVHLVINASSKEEVPFVFLDALCAKHHMAFGFHARDVYILRQTEFATLKSFNG